MTWSSAGVIFLVTEKTLIMESIKHFAAENLDGFVEQVSRDFASGTSLHDYHVTCQLGDHRLKLNIASSPGGSTEGGYESTSINAALLSGSNFNFVLYPEDFMITIGKFFGLQDIVLGYAEFDKNVVIKTNDAAKLTTVLAGEGTRKILQNLSGFALKLESDDEGNTLDLSIQRALMDIKELNQVLAMFYEVLVNSEAGASSTSL